MTTNQDPYLPPAAALGRQRSEPGSPSAGRCRGIAGHGTRHGHRVRHKPCSLGLEGDELAAAAENISPDSWLFISSSAVGCLFSALGAYICARIVNRAELTWGAVMATISVLLGVLMVSMDDLRCSPRSLCSPLASSR